MLFECIRGAQWHCLVAQFDQFSVHLVQITGSVGALKEENYWYQRISLFCMHIDQTILTCQPPGPIHSLANDVTIFR